MKDSITAKGVWRFTARDAQGTVIDARDIPSNRVVDEGLNELLSAALAGGTPSTSWFIGLMSGSPTVAAGDTMATHGGWTEVQGFDESARVAWTPGTVASKQVDNSASLAVFTITASGTTIGGAFLANNATKGGTTGKLYAGGAFNEGDITLPAGATLEVEGRFLTAAA